MLHEEISSDPKYWLSRDYTRRFLWLQVSEPLLDALLGILDTRPLFQSLGRRTGCTLPPYVPTNHSTGTVPLFMPTNNRARIPSPLSLRVAKTGRNHLNDEITPLLPTGIGEQF
jgi:hypothetical protein